MARRPTIADLMARIEAQEEQIASLTVKPKSAKASTFTEGVRDADGNVAGGFACTAGKVGGKACKRVLRTEKRAAAHGVDEGGHEFRA